MITPVDPAVLNINEKMKVNNADARQKRGKNKKKRKCHRGVDMYIAD